MIRVKKTNFKEIFLVCYWKRKNMRDVWVCEEKQKESGCLSSSNVVNSRIEDFLIYKKHL